MRETTEVTPKRTYDGRLVRVTAVARLEGERSISVQVEALNPLGDGQYVVVELSPGQFDQLAWDLASVNERVQKVARSWTLAFNLPRLSTS